MEENAQLEELIDQHHSNTQQRVQTVVADKQYGTADNFRRLKQRGITTHMDLMHGGPSNKKAGIIPLEQFIYDPDSDTYTCPANQKLYKRRYDPRRQATEYHTRKGVCQSCALRRLCTRSKSGRTLMRHRQQELLILAELKPRALPPIETDAEEAL